VLNPDLIDDIDKRMRELLRLLENKASYKRIGGAALKLVNEYAEDGQPDLYSRKLFRADWESYLAPYWYGTPFLGGDIWLGDEHYHPFNSGRLRNAFTQVFEQMFCFLREATTPYHLQKLSRQLQDACCSYLALRGDRRLPAPGIPGRRPEMREVAQFAIKLKTSNPKLRNKDLLEHCRKKFPRKNIKSENTLRAAIHREKKRNQ
jgi:hypothetical protein